MKTKPRAHLSDFKFQLSLRPDPVTAPPSALPEHLLLTQTLYTGGLAKGPKGGMVGVIAVSGDTNNSSIKELSP